MIVNPDNRRGSARINLDRPVNLEFINEGYSHCRAKDISLSGMFAFGVFQEKVGKYCLFNLLQKEGTKELSLQASARVVRENDEGIAVEFTSMPFDSFMSLQITLLYEAEFPFDVKKLLPDKCPFVVTDRW